MTEGGRPVTRAALAGTVLQAGTAVLAHFVPALHAANGEDSLDADGYLDIPSAPGLGVTLNEEALARYGTRPDFAVAKA